MQRPTAITPFRGKQKQNQTKPTGVGWTQRHLLNITGTVLELTVAPARLTVCRSCTNTGTFLWLRKHLGEGFRVSAALQFTVVIPASLSFIYHRQICSLLLKNSNRVN